MLLIIGAVLVGIIVLLSMLFSGDSAAPTAAGINGIKDKTDQVEYLESLGYTVDQGSRTSKMVTIPKTFDDVYLTYNTMQQECGFDLLNYTGKKVEIVTYMVTNYPTEDEVLVDLLLYQDSLIGGALYTTAIDGFMHGLRRAEPVQTN